MKPIKRLQYTILATIVATASHKLPAPTSPTPIPVTPTPIPTAPIPISGKITINPKNRLNFENIASQSRNAEIAAQGGSMNRLASRMSDAVFGKKVVRDPLTNQKITDQSIIDNLSLQPETQVKNESGQALELSSISKKGFAANKAQRNLTDTASNYARNLVSRSNKKLTKRQDQQTAYEYQEFAKPGDKIVETWSRDGKTLLESKILSPDGSYKIISNHDGVQGKITFARTADGKTTQNLYENGIIKDSITTTPRTLNALLKNSMLTGTITTYNTNGYPIVTLTYKKTAATKAVYIISTKRYSSNNPMAYELKNAAGKILETRTVDNDFFGNPRLTTRVLSPKDKMITKQIITLDANNNIISIQTFTKAQESSSNKASEILAFNADGSVVKTVTNAQGKPEKKIIVKADQMVIDAAYESMSGNTTVTSNKTAVARLKPSESSTSTPTLVEGAPARENGLVSSTDASGQTPVGTTSVSLSTSTQPTMVSTSTSTGTPLTLAADGLSAGNAGVPFSPTSNSNV